MMTSTARAFAAILGLALLAHGGDDRTKRNARTTPWISLMASEVRVDVLGDLKVIARAEHLTPEASSRGEWDIRTADGRRRVARLPYPWRLGNGQSVATGVFGLSSTQLTRIGQIDDGQYLLAWYVKGVRGSNVVRFRIGKDDDRTRLPLLETVEIARGSPGHPVLLGIRARRHARDDPAPCASDVAFATLIVEGQRRRLDVICWVGADGPLPAGRHYAYLLDLRRYRPRVAPRKGQTVAAEVRVRGGAGKDYRSRPFVLTLDRSLEEAWDRATAELGPVPPPRLALSGTVIRCNGHLGKGYLVSLSREGRLWQTVKADGDGAYEFYSVPTGKYELTTHPPGRGQPALVWHDVALDTRQSQRLDLVLEKRYSFSGRITYNNGTPAAGHEVMATWPSPDGRAEYHDFAVTDGDGRYVLAAPYEVASFVGCGSKPVRRGVEAGRDRVDFVIKKPR